MFGISHKASHVGVQLLIVLNFFYITSTQAAPPQAYTGREYAEVMLLLSQSDFDIRLAGKSLYRLSSNRQDIPDLLAEVIWSSCSGNRNMAPDSLSWLAKALGNTKQARYTALLDYCLARNTDEKVIKYLTLAKAELLGTPGDAFVGGKIDLQNLRARLKKQGKLPSGNSIAKQFDTVQRGQTLEDVYAALGAPNDLSGINVPGDSVGYRVKIRTSEDMILFGYSGLGTIRFIYDKTKADWLLADAKSSKGLFWSRQDGRFATVSDLIATGNALDLRDALKYLNKQDTIDRAILDRVAERIYRSRLEEDEDLVDMLAHLCKVIRNSIDGRYKQIMLTVSDTAGSKTLRKYAAKAARDLPEAAEGQYVPPPG